MKIKPTGLAISATLDDETGWVLHVHRAFTTDDGRTSSYRMRYRGLSNAELVSVIDCELDDLSAGQPGAPL